MAKKQSESITKAARKLPPVTIANFAIGEQVNYIGQDCKDQYGNLTLTVDEIVRDGNSIVVACRKPDGYFTTWLNPDELVPLTKVGKTVAPENNLPKKSIELTAITLHQPWASLISVGCKQYETRDWKTSYKGLIAIHAGCKPKGKQKLRDHENVVKSFCNLLTEDCPYSSVIAIAEMTDCILMTEKFISQQTETELSCGNWQVGRYAFKLENVRSITPTQATGKQGFWKWEYNQDLPDTNTLTPIGQPATALTLMLPEVLTRADAGNLKEIVTTWWDVYYPEHTQSLLIQLFGWQSVGTRYSVETIFEWLKVQKPVVRDRVTELYEMVGRSPKIATVELDELIDSNDIGF